MTIKSAVKIMIIINLTFRQTMVRHDCYVMLVIFMIVLLMIIVDNDNDNTFSGGDMDMIIMNTLIIILFGLNQQDYHDYHDPDCYHDHDCCYEHYDHDDHDCGNNAFREW